MKLSFKAKLFLLVSVAISFAALPIIFFSRDFLIENSMKRERDSFVNTVMLVEENIGAHYLNMLAAELEAVIVAKEDLSWCASMIRSMEDLSDSHDRIAHLWHWQKFFRDTGYSMAMYDLNGLPVIEDRLVRLALAPGMVDFKGQPMRAKITPQHIRSSASFAVVYLKNGNKKDTPVLLCFMPVPKQGMLVLGIEVSDILSNRISAEKSLVGNVQERLTGLELTPGTSVAIIAGNGKVQASRGYPIALDDIPAAVREKVRAGHSLEGESVGPNGNGFLYHITYFKPLDWYIVAIIPTDVIKEPAEVLSRYLFCVAFLIILLSLLVMFSFTARLIRPLGVLTEKARELAEENFSADDDTHLEEKIREGMPVKRTDEVGQLASSFAYLGKALDENIRNLKDTVAVRQRMEGELNAARDIQMGILPPPDSAPSTEHYAASAFLLPAKEVGGDLYDFFTAPDGKQVIVIGDVSDKGVSAALFMSMTVTLVRYAMAEGLSCAEAMRRINDRLAENNPSCMFVTLFIGLFDPETGELDYASGAHCPPFVVSPDTSVPVRALMDTSGPLVGAMGDMDFEPCHATIAPGEYCLIYTDGVSEAMNEEKQLFTEERIAEVLDGIRDAEPEQVVARIMDEIVLHRGNAAQSDDITMLCFKRK